MVGLWDGTGDAVPQSHNLTIPQSLLGLALALAACSGQPKSIELTPLAEGEWNVVDVNDDGAILMRARSRAAELAILTDTLQPLEAETFTVSNIQLARAGGHYFSPAGRPRLLQSPADQTRYVFEHEDAVWVFKASDRSLHKLTLDEDVAVLRGKQREGEVILYWSVDPVWNGTGDFIAFHSNREAVRADARNSQSIWVIDAGTGVQKQLLYKEGVSYHIDGVLGEELLLSSSGQPGVLAVHPRTGALRTVSEGYVLASHAGGDGALIQRDSSLVWLHADSEVIIAPPAPGWTWGGAQISPSGNNIAVLSTDGAANYVLHVAPASGSGLTVPLPAPPSSGPAWVSDAAVLMVVMPRGRSAQTHVAVIR